jgi:DMSO/TMAO reductase YedYZ molybdopterin-dependent catalytic subunit
MLGALVLLLALGGLLLPSTPVAVAQQGSFSEGFDLTGLVDHPKHFTMADLQAYPPVTITAAYGAAQSFETGRYTGVQLWDLLQEAGVQFTPGRRNDLLRKYVVVTGADGYDAMFSLGELSPDFGGEFVLVGYAKDGQPLAPNEGMARIVTNADKRGGRLVSNVAKIEVRDVDSAPRSGG